MAKLGSRSCRPLVQGMMLLALLLVASIQAGPVMAAPWEQAVHQVEEAVDKVQVEEAVDKVQDTVVKKVPDQALTELGKAKPALKPSIDGAKKGLRVHRYLCKAQRLMDKQNPGGASGTLNFAVDIRGGDLLSKSLPTFSYSVTSNSVVPCRYYSGSQQVPPKMSFRITGISVGLEEIRVEPPVYLSTTQPAYTNQEISMYGQRLREAVNRQMMKAAKPIADADPLCYVAAKWSLPRIAILLGSDNGGVMQTTELSVDATGTVWYPEPFTFCLGIRTTVELVLGRP